MAEEDGWVRGPALQILEMMNGVTPGDYVQTPDGRVWSVARTNWSEYKVAYNFDNKPYCLRAPGEPASYGRWGRSSNGIVGWKRGERG